MARKQTGTWDRLVERLMKDPEFAAEHERLKTICALSPEMHEEERPVEIMFRGTLGVCMECYDEMCKPKPSHQILMSQDLIQAILSGKKTQTRRVIKPQPPEYASAVGKSFFSSGPGEWEYRYYHKSYGPTMSFFKCPYGAPSDLLWVREPWSIDNTSADTWGAEETAVVVYPEGARYDAGGYVTVRYKDGQEKITNDPIYDDDWEHWWTKYIEPRDEKWRSPIHMPRWASRLTLWIENIGVERVQSISEDDAIAEGVHNDMNIVWQSGDDTPIGMFGEVWDSLNAKRGYSWDSNPWVWVIDFLVTKEEGK